MQNKCWTGVLLCVLCALCLLLPGLAEGEVYGIVQGGWLNIRQQPSTDAEVIESVPSGTRVRILAEQEGWYHAEIPDGITGYMSANYIILGQPAIIQNDGNFVNLRSSASFESEVVGTFDSGTPAEMYDTGEEWTLVYVDGHTGYMVSHFLELAPTGAALGPALQESTVAQSDPADGGVVPNPTPAVLSAPQEATTAPGALLLGEMAVPGVTPSATATPDPAATPLPTHLVTVAPTPETIAPEPAPVTPQVVQVAGAPTEAPTPGLAEEVAVAPEDNPYLLLMDSGANLVQQYGVSESYVDYREGFFCTVVYPVSGLEVADEAMRGWAKTLVQEAEQVVLQSEDAMETELTVQYDAYFVGGRYVGIQETGWYNTSLLSQPNDVVYTQNIDLMTGTLMTYRDIFPTDQIPAVLDLLAQRLAAGPLASLDIVPQENWLEQTVILADGVAVLLPKGLYLPEAWGTQRVVLDYQELAGAGMLAMEKPEPVETAQATPSPQALPVGPGDRTIDPGRPMVALTFDDGPSETTPQILALLNQYGGRATFFVVGNRLANYNDMLVQIAEQGSEIGCHTWSHKKLTQLKDSDIEWQLTKTTASVLDRTGVEVKLMRPPYGSHNSNVRAVSRNLGLGVIFWSIDTEDWRTRSAGATYEVIMKEVKNGSIILCHDLHEATGEAMERVIPALVEQGYQLVTVSELLSFLPEGMQPGRVYSQLDTTELSAQ